MRHALDRWLYVLREVHELTWIGEGLRVCDVTGLEDKLRLVVGGADFAALDRNTASRDTQYELRIAAYLGRAGFRVRLDTLTDIVATRRRTTYHIECKRIARAVFRLSPTITSSQRCARQGYVRMRPISSAFLS